MSFHRTIRTIIRLSALLAVVALAKGCGDGESPSAPPMPEPARPTTVTVSPATTELTVLGATVQLSAEVRDQNNRVMAGATVTWTSSANSVATVDAAGLVTAVGNGTATITASAGDARGTATVTVVEEAAPDDHGNSIATATPVAIGATVQGVLTEGDEDYFEIPVPTDGFRLSVFTEGDTDTYGTLFDRNGVSLSSDDDSGEALNFHIVQVLDAGTHYLSIASFFGDTGDYSLVVEEAAPDDHGNSIATATPVAIGATVQGVLETGGDEDYFEIPVPTDGFRLSVFTEGDTDTYGTLFDRNGVSLSSDDDSGEALNFHIVQVLDAGTHYLSIASFFGDTGDYSLVVEEAAPDDHGNSIATATPVAIGATVQGVLETGGDEDYFEIPVPTDGFRLSVFTEGDTDTYGTLFDRNGVSLSSDDDSGEALNFHIVQVLDAGTHYLSIASFFGDTGDYSLVVEETAPDDHGNSIATATPVAIGATVQGVLETEGDEDYFEIPVPTDGFRLSVFTEGDTDTYGTLFDRNGVSLSSDDDSGETLNFHIVQVLDAGTHYLSIASFFGDTGDYSLVVEEAAPDDHGNSIATATPVAIGATVQGVLETGGDEDYFEIPVPTDGFRLGIFTEGNTTDTYGTLFDQNGAVLSSDDDSGEAFNFHIVQVLDAGTYYLSIAGFFGDTGDYSLVVEEAAPDDHGNSIATATPVAIGATVQGVLETGGDEDYFEIPVPTDGFRLGIFTEGNTTDTYGTLFDQNGAVLSSDDDSGEAFNFHIVQVLDAGTYYLSIAGFFGDTGDYSLVVEEAAPGSRATSDTVSPKALGKKKQSFPPDRE